MASLQAPPGQRLLPALVDELAQSTPERILYSIPCNHDLAKGFRDITIKTFAQAVNHCAWYIAQNLGPGNGFPTLMYMGPQDLMYITLILACNKTGYKLLLNSLRNPLKENLLLLDKMDCSTFLTPSNCSLPMVNKILAAKEMRVLEVPSMDELFHDSSACDIPVQPYPYTKTFVEAKYDPFVVLHTSGSTGALKPIIQTNATIASFDAIMASSLDPPPYPAMCKGKRLYVTYPLFHCGGIHLALPGPLFCEYTVVLGPFPPSAIVVNRVHIYGNVQYTSLAAITLVELAKSPDYLENLRLLEHVAYGGGPCPKAVGDLVATKTRLKTSFGSTEAGAMPTLLCDPEDWAYIKFSPFLGVEYRHVTEDLYEQVIVRDPKIHQYQGIFGTFPELQEWPMKDLYSRHPTKSNLWMHKGRLDDVIVYSTGEKLNPLGTEGIINSHPKVKGTLVAGSGRAQSCLLVECNEIPTSETERHHLLETIWPTVELANTEIPSHARIHPNMILFTNGEKQMPRAGKGTIQRKAAINLYRGEIEALYMANESSISHNRYNTVRFQIRLELAIQDILAKSTDIELAKADPDTNLFEQGLDSLQVILIVKETNDYLSARDTPTYLNTRTVYANPTINGLTAVVRRLAQGKVIAPDYDTKDNGNIMKGLYDANIRTLPSTRSKAVLRSPEDTVILLTGSTGSLGSYILDLLVKDPHISMVYCLSRGAKSRESQEKSQERKGLDELPKDKIEFLEADYSKPHLGLRITKYMELLRRVTSIIHSAWKVDFNLTAESFAMNIASVTSLIDFSAHSTFGAEMFFLSTVGAVANWQIVTGQSESVPETIFDGWCMPDCTGYAQSKFISERLLDAAVKEGGLSGVVCRLGQIAGPTTRAGAWSRQEWLPSLVASSKYMGKIPNSLGKLEMIDWVPVDLMARCVVELATHSGARHSGAGALVYHLVNPEKCRWEDLLPSIEKMLGGLEKVSLAAWVETLYETASRTKDLARNPAVKLLDFFDHLASGGITPVNLSTVHAREVSQTLVGLEPVNGEWMENWIRQWEL